MSETVAAQVQWHRRRRDLTRKQLADECQRLGDAELTFAAVTSIETGRRDDSGRRRRGVTVDELAILALALRVPPVLLLFPLRADQEVPWSPGQTADPWSAIQWFTGESQPPGEEAEPGSWSSLAKSPLDAYRDHELQTHQWWQSYMRSSSWEERAGNAKSPEMREKLLAAADLEDAWRADAIEDLIDHDRQVIREAGLVPPKTSPEIAERVEDK